MSKLQTAAVAAGRSIATAFTATSYVIYLRRSTDDKKNQQNTLRYQVEQCLRYAQALNLPIAQLTIDGVCTDGIIREKHSAFERGKLDIGEDGVVRMEIKRPKFQRLVAMLARQQIKGVIALNNDRLSRNGQDDTILDELLARGIEVHYVQRTYDKNSAGYLHRKIDATVAEVSSLQSGERIRAVNAKLRAEGKWPSMAPLGYLNHGPGDKPLDPAKSPIVREMFKHYATGDWSIAQLAKWARDQGLTMRPRRPNRSMEEILEDDEDGEDLRPPVSLPVTAKCVEQMLTRPFYAGILRHGDEEFTGVHEPLITRALFQRVQDVMHGRNRSVQYVDKEFFTYRGVVRCVCTRLYVPYRQKGHVYHQVRCHEGCTNSARNMSEALIDDLVVQVLEGLHLTDTEVAQLEKAAPRELPRLEQQRHERTREQENKRVQLRRDLAYLNDNKISLLREGVYDGPEFSAEVRRLEKAIAEIADLRNAAGEVKPNEMLNEVFKFTELVNVARIGYKHSSGEEKRTFLLWAITELFVTGRNVANVSAREGFEDLRNMRFADFGAPKIVFAELPRLYNIITHLPPAPSFLQHEQPASGYIMKH